jgi:hypothetical protein
VSDAKLEMHTKSRSTQDGVDETPPLGPLTRKDDEDDLTSMSCTTGATIGHPLDLRNPFSDEVDGDIQDEDVLESGMYANGGNLEDAKEPDVATGELLTDNEMESDELYYFDPDDLWRDEYAIGKEVNLMISGNEIMRDVQVHEFLSDLGYEELTGYNEDFDTFEYGIQAINGLRAINKFDDDDLERLRPNLAWKPLEVICQTLKNTTQFARDVIRFPMRRHFASRWLRYGTKHLRETVSTDTYFASIPDVSGATCTQAFWGVRSHMINVYGMRREAEFPYVYADFLREEGAPQILQRDNSQTQRSHKVTEMNRDYLVKDEWSEAHYQNQNPVESRAIKWLKESAHTLMDRKNVPECLWLQAHKYLAGLHSVTADETLGWKTPREV